jgi:hypothetical protein
VEEVLAMEISQAGPQPPEGRIFYRDSAVCVTERWLTIPGRRYAIGELRNLRMVREPAPPIAAASTVMACVVGLAAATFVVLSGDPALMMGGPVLAVVPAGVALVSWRMRRRFFALYADYRGRVVQVHGDVDERRFNQVGRALIRAGEYGRERDYGREYGR